MKPLTIRMEECLAALARFDAQHRLPVTPNQIGREAGHDDGGRRHGNGANQSTTGWQAPANRVNFALLGLEKRGLVRWVSRRDGLSGRAIDFTTEGIKAAKTISQDWSLDQAKRNRGAGRTTRDRVMGRTR